MTPSQRAWLRDIRDAAALVFILGVLTLALPLIAHLIHGS